MKKQTSSRRVRALHPYSDEQLAGLRLSTEARKKETVERLQKAIVSLKSKKQAITAQSIYEECGLHYATILRNPEAIALFRANSTHLSEQKKRIKRKRKTSDDTASPPLSRDILLNYNKAQLVLRLREAQQQISDLQRQLVTLADACLQRDAQVVGLEAKLKELEPYQSFVEQVRQRMQQEEHSER